MKNPTVDTTLTERTIEWNMPQEMKFSVQEYISQIPHNPAIYTDGCAFTLNNSHMKYKLPPTTRIYTAGLIALLEAVEQIESLEINNKHSVICSDSLPALNSIRKNRKRTQ
ncbi:hypothetical protein HHI36_002666 [Cryptolaemus montrouzieri]|uniref:RNase H type-1 domain-containing protein n=1 Tax=Cryptolaemus montrouzieri TaxID=559131 RepID=A0ABD2PC43_9CUCU